MLKTLNALLIFKWNIWVLSISFTENIIWINIFFTKYIGRVRLARLLFIFTDTLRSTPTSSCLRKPYGHKFSRNILDMLAAWSRILHSGIGNTDLARSPFDGGCLSPGWWIWLMTCLGIYRSGRLWGTLNNYWLKISSEDSVGGVRTPASNANRP